MEMVAVGGYFLEVTTANNFMGHGFYQFSPELYYRVFSQQNGYIVEDMLLCETDPRSKWRRVADPQALGQRVELVNRRPTYLIVKARRTHLVEIFRTLPQQSDYVSLWSYELGNSVSQSSQPGPRGEKEKTSRRKRTPHLLARPL